MTATVDAPRITDRKPLGLDAMLGTLDFVANSDWVTILPGIMMVSDVDRPLLTINPIVEPVLPLDLVLIEPLRHSLSPAARAFVDILREETRRLNAVWHPYLAGGQSELSIPPESRARNAARSSSHPPPARRCDGSDP